MQAIGVPVVLDVTHSLQVPNRASGTSGGHPQFIETLAKAGIAAGADGIFLETHPDPVMPLNLTAKTCFIWICWRISWKN